jgi:hypothetical protein
MFLAANESCLVKAQDSFAKALNVDMFMAALMR